MNVVASMHERLPELNVPDIGDSYRNASFSESTAVQHAPFGWIAAGADPLFEQANRSIERCATPLGGGFAPDALSLYSVGSEGDVLMVAEIYLVHPVNMALRQLHPELRGRLRCRSEHRFPGRTQHIDLVWTYQTPDATMAVAMLKYEQPFVLREDEFLDAMFHDRASVAAAMQLLAGTRRETLFRANALVLMKEARKYAVGGIRDVCIFDWRSMFVVDFKPQEEGIDCVEGIWLDEANGNNAPGRTFRKLLLGFLLRALRRHEIIVSCYSTFYFFMSNCMSFAAAAHC